MSKIKIILVLIVQCCCVICSFAQDLDTLEFRLFEIVSNRITSAESYKKQLLDSSILAGYSLKKVADLLQNETPVFVKSYGLGSVSTLSFRGTGAAHSQIYWNGIPANSPVLGMNDVSLLPVDFADDVELHYGLSSLVDGTGGLGGALQLNNVPNWSDKLNLKSSIKTGSYGFYGVDFKWSIVFKNVNIQSGFINVRAENDFTFYNRAKVGIPLEKQLHAAYRQKGMYHNIFYRLNSKNHFAIKLNYFDSYREEPKLITQENNDAILKDKTFRSSLEWSSLLGQCKLNTQAGYWQENLDYTSELAGIESSYLVDNLVTNVNLKRERLNGLSFNVVYNGGYSYVRHDYYTASVGQFRNAGMLSLTKAFNQKLHLNGLVRKELVSNKFSPWLPSLGLRYDIFKLLGLKLNVARSYRFPSFNALYWNSGGSKGNPNLLPENGWSGELGFDFSFVKDRIELNVELTTFYANVDDWIIWLPDDFSGIWSPVNIREVITQGVELMTKGVLSFQDLKIKWTGVASVNYSESIEGGAAYQLIYVPILQYKNTFTFTYKDFDLVYNHVYTDRRFITSDNNWYMPDYQIGNMELKAKMNIAKSSFYCTFGVDNIWNKEYQSIAWRPMPGRNYFVKITHQFKR